MTLNWTVYPTSGRTNWFGGERANIPCGVGWSYNLHTTGAVGIYAQFNSTETVITREDATAEDLAWLALEIPVGFFSVPILHKKLPPGESPIEWSYFIDHDDVTKSVRLQVSLTDPNLRFNFTTPPARNAIGELLPDCPNPWTISPLTLEQTNES